jgi:hypothetical protein
VPYPQDLQQLQALGDYVLAKCLLDAVEGLLEGCLEGADVGCDLDVGEEILHDLDKDLTVLGHDLGQEILEGLHEHLVLETVRDRAGLQEQGPDRAQLPVVVLLL